MSDTKQVLQRARDRFEPPENVMGSLIRRRERKERNRRISAAIIGIAVALLGLASLTWVFRSTGRPADQPTPTPKPPGIFSGVGGWIVYGNQGGIWAVDPSHPGDPGSQIQLSPNRGTPLAWSRDGSELLISRRSAPLRGLFVLHADGTETRLVRDPVSGASFSPDGTTVVFAPGTWAPNYLDPSYLDPGIYLIDADGGVPKLLLAPSRRYYPPEDRSFLTGLAFPTFSPDGTQIAYIDGIGDWGNSLRVMDADGSDVHVLDGSDVHLLESGEAPNGTGSVRSLGMHPNGLSWSPDGTHLAVGLLNDGISVVDADGSGLTLTIPDGANPYWSPDGTRISYRLHHLSVNRLRWVISPLMIAAADGTGVQEFGYAASGPWNPLVQPEPGVAEAPLANEGSTPASILLPLTAFLTLVVGFVLMRRRRRAPGA
jgi:Tol biopolymer transport system component